MSHNDPLPLFGDCSVRQISSVHSELVAALGAAVDLTIDCALVERADIAFCQLMISAKMTAKRRNKRLKLVNIPADVEMVFLRAGLSGDALGPVNY